MRISWFWIVSLRFAAGLEYREETSRNNVNPFDQGILPQGTPFSPGALISSVSGNESLGFNGGTSRTLNSEGRYDVTDLFGEIRVPLVTDRKFFRDLSVDGAVRFADYSTSGLATTWKLGASWALDDSLSFRGTLSEAIRAPSITELFSPQQPIFVRPNDPCDVTIIPTAPDPQLRAANCIEAGLPADFRDPLTARQRLAVSTLRWIMILKLLRMRLDWELLVHANLSLMTFSILKTSMMWTLHYANFRDQNCLAMRRFRIDAVLFKPPFKEAIRVVKL